MFFKQKLVFIEMKKENCVALSAWERWVKVFESYVVGAIHSTVVATSQLQRNILIGPIM